MTTGVATIEQTLHGYDAGHRLLHSSVNLPPDAREILAALSDLSGTRLYAGFESYLSGYPLEGTEYYVFARTWLAPEMPRPGCVWTHSLLIPVADLAFVRSLPRLGDFHVRPGGDQRTEYSKAVSVPLFGRDARALNESELHLAGLLVNGLYGPQSERPIIIAASDSRTFEHLVLRLWDQQWPRLRRTFKFCTGALSKRIVNGSEFDLQVMPVQAARLAAHGSSTVIESTPNVVSEDATETRSARVDQNEGRQRWLEAIVTDVALGDPESPLRQWMVLIGAEGAKSRGLASDSLRLAALLAERPQRVNEVVRLIAEMYPDADAGTRIKKAILGPASDMSDDRRSLPEGEVLMALATTPHVEAFAILGDDMRARASQFWLREPVQASRMLLGLAHKSINGLGGDVLRGLAEAIPASQFAAIACSRPGLIALAVQTRPALLEESEIWAAPQLTREALQALHLVPPSARPSPQTVLRAFARSELDDSAALAALYPPRELTEALAALISTGEADAALVTALVASSSLRRSLTVGLPEVFADVAENCRVLTVLADAADVDTLSRVPVRDWLSAARRHAHSISSPLASAMLAVSMASADREAGVLASQVFPVVYEATRTGHLVERAWQKIVAGLPLVPSWLEWDRCERLRRWLIEAFVSKKPWKFQDFVAAIPGGDALDGLLDYGQSQSRLRDFLHRLADAIDEGRVVIGDRQRDAILEVGRPRRWKIF